ncbi:lutropin-choriogonadotropic hormone receptor-like [Hydractinia symbiolongicarpus]|uniref:lutropin-choriogonadotropic hormone receptor-like n=1 Tax=Hydractinia symbiolongicarpus TaxID=13093 RepID=UPI00254ADAE0|nr:lutropin-choriogonadotropic hormone receptor-like [Hydractinia symbiolongicarpus]
MLEKFILVVVVIGMCSAKNNKTVQSREIDMNQLDFVEVPKKILTGSNGITSLLLSFNKIKYISNDSFPIEACKEMRYINLHANYITHIHEDAFANMPNLLEIDLSNNQLTKVPKLNAPSVRKVILQNNKISELTEEAMSGYTSLVHFDLKHNQIKNLYGDTFLENKDLFFLSLSNNPLKTIHDNAFRGPTNLRFLYLDSTLIKTLPPYYGISTVETLSLKNTPNLFTIPDPSKFKNLKNVSVTYRMHCCAFYAQRLRAVLNNATLCTTSKPILTTENPLGSFKQKKVRGLNTTVDEDDPFGDSEFNDLFGEVMNSFNKASNVTNSSCYDNGELVGGKPKGKYMEVECNPEPDAFNPCQDVMGTNVLRVFSWVISMFAIIGNMFQLVILFHSRQELSVYKLLMYNLGFSNLLMGIYLMVLCCVDSYTYGEYYNFVQSWQYNGGCQAFGFIALFATQLSVCSLMLITAERFLLIIFALQVGNQMKLSHAKMGVAAAWIYSFIVSVLPVTNEVSSYSKTAICLPMDVHSVVSEGYVVWLLITYVLAFFLIVFCYVRMYRSISSVRPGCSNHPIDTKVAKRMALIIFSNFLCWLPISIAGLLALYSGTVFNVDVAKFLLVFIFPLNACTNPFLYAIFTKVFRGDTISLLSTIGLCKQADDEHQRGRSSSYFKSKGKKRADTNDRHFLHIQAPMEGCTYSNERNIEAQTDFDSPETPIKVMIDPNERQSKHGRLQRLNDEDSPPSTHQRRNYEEHNKPRSDSQRGLLDEYKRRADSSDTCSTGMSSVQSATEIDDDFSRRIGSVTKAENSILFS